MRVFRKRRLRLWASVAAIALATNAAVARAQEEEATPEAENERENEIVVTATLRDEDLSRVPVSVSAYSQETMDQQGVRRVDDIAAKTPGVTLTRGDGRNAAAATISIRGIASTAGSATTGIYIDDTPIQVRSIGFSAYNPFPAVFDLERVEVLRGPQGTLFGAGSEGGTLRFITPRPDLNDIRAYGRAELATTEGGAESYELGGAVSVPLVTDKVAFRASGYFRRDGGYLDRVDFDRATR